MKDVELRKSVLKIVVNGGLGYLGKNFNSEPEAIMGEATPDFDLPFFSISRWCVSSHSSPVVDSFV